MSANVLSEETKLVDDAVAWLAEHLPPNWTVERRDQPTTATDAERQPLDATIEVRGPNATYTTFAVEAKRSLFPRDVERLLPGLTRLLRSLAGNVPVLVVAPWLSARTQELLEKESISYVDLTGNALIRLDNPAVYIKTQGARRNPQPEPRSPASVRGPKAARLIRLLADVRPPYGVREIANATRLAPGYVSRLLDALDREALVERSRKGEVESVDVRGLLRRWTESYDLLKSNDSRRFVAAAGVTKALERLSGAPSDRRWAVSGSFAAVRFAPVAAPALLVVYTEDIETIASVVDLLPADEGANVVLLRPFDGVVWERTMRDQAVTYVATSQAAVDCMTGTGRMPAEGDALLSWMVENESRWRLGSLGEHATAKGSS